MLCQTNARLGTVVDHGAGREGTARSRAQLFFHHLTTCILSAPIEGKGNRANAVSFETPATESRLLHLSDFDPLQLGTVWPFITHMQLWILTLLAHGSCLPDLSPLGCRTNARHPSIRPRTQHCATSFSDTCVSMGRSHVMVSLRVDVLVPRGIWLGQ